MSSLREVFILPHNVLDDISNRARIIGIDQKRLDRVPVVENGLPTTHRFIPSEERSVELAISRQLYINKMRLRFEKIRTCYFITCLYPDNRFNGHKDVFWLFPKSSKNGVCEYPLSDDLFAEQRFCGLQINCLKSLFDLSIWGQLSDPLNKKYDDGWLYQVDYSQLKKLKKKNGIDNLPHVSGLFSKTETGEYTTEMIRIDEKIYGPRDGGIWNYAKSMFQMCDGIYFFIVNRLCGAFLFVEPIVIYFYRNIAVNHPLYPLLNPLFFGHASCCKAIKDMMTKEDGLLLNMLPVTKEGIVSLMKNAYNAWNFDETNFVKKVSAKKLDNTDGIAYVEDGMSLYTCVNNFMTTYVHTVYLSDNDVTADVELQNWFRETNKQNEGAVKGFPENALGRNQLIKTLTHIFFLFYFDRYIVQKSIYDQMCFMPSYPLNVKEHPLHCQPYTTQEVVNLLGTEDKTLEQMYIIHILSNDIMVAPMWEKSEMTTVLFALVSVFNDHLNKIKAEIYDKLKKRDSPYRSFALSQKEIFLQ